MKKYGKTHFIKEDSYFIVHSVACTKLRWETTVKDPVINHSSTRLLYEAQAQFSFRLFGRGKKPKAHMKY